MHDLPIVSSIAIANINSDYYYIRHNYVSDVIILVMDTSLYNNIIIMIMSFI